MLLIGKGLAALSDSSTQLAEFFLDKCSLGRGDPIRLSPTAISENEGRVTFPWDSGNGDTPFTSTSLIAEEIDGEPSREEHDGLGEEEGDDEEDEEKDSCAFRLNVGSVEAGDAPVELDVVASVEDVEVLLLPCA